MRKRLASSLEARRLILLSGTQVQITQQDLVAEKSGSMLETMTEGYTMDVRYGDIVLGLVNLAGE